MQEENSYRRLTKQSRNVRRRRSMDSQLRGEPSTLSTQIAAFGRTSAQLGKTKDKITRSCEPVLGVLDGPEVDSGTASEIGFATALGKICYGLRTDFHNSGDSDGIPINLQALYWIESSGGQLFRRIEDISLP